MSNRTDDCPYALGQLVLCTCGECWKTHQKNATEWRIDWLAADEARERLRRDCGGEPQAVRPFVQWAHA